MNKNLTNKMRRRKSIEEIWNDFKFKEKLKDVE